MYIIIKPYNNPVYYLKIFDLSLLTVDLSLLTDTVKIAERLFMINNQSFMRVFFSAVSCAIACIRIHHKDCDDVFKQLNNKYQVHVGNSGYINPSPIIKSIKLRRPEVSINSQGVANKLKSMWRHYTTPCFLRTSQLDKCFLTNEVSDSMF